MPLKAYLFYRSDVHPSNRNADPTDPVDTQRIKRNLDAYMYGIRTLSIAAPPRTDALSSLAKFIQQSAKSGIRLLFPSHVIANAINVVSRVHLRENLLHATGCIAPTFRAISHSTVFPADHILRVYTRIGSSILFYLNPVHTRR